MGLVSNCCGASIGIDYVDYEICPDCHEHCEVLNEDDLEMEDLIMSLNEKYNSYLGDTSDETIKLILLAMSESYPELDSDIIEQEVKDFLSMK